MLLQTAPQHEAILSNVGEIGEFRIRNSAKAFNILSSGLYANKIRAIIRELSCNAVDSHVAANKKETPFDVHLPNTLEPWFSIRDYGTGLTHEQVINIYTTYFESTKTGSNDFIGALGLGSKSPFSYTDNFTVTAIRDGVRGVYSAFINGEGVPSIALMHSEQSTEPAGVEIKFAVESSSDFYKFMDEAEHVYTYFELRPVIHNASDFKFRDIEYTDKNVVPGIHVRKHDRYGASSRAIMGNICYPIDVPNPQQSLGDLSELLRCGLDIHFNIGELDFQASREGLSYIPQTIESIKRRLEALNAQLAVHLAMEADTYTSVWKKTNFLITKGNQQLWSAAVRKYIKDTKYEYIDIDSSILRRIDFKIDVKDVAQKYNISVQAFTKSRGSATCSDTKAAKVFKNGGYVDFDEMWEFPIEDASFFIENDLKIGALSRAKYHWRKSTDLPKTQNYTHHVFVLSPADRTKTMNLSAFYKELQTPPSEQLIKASSLLQKERTLGAARAKDVRIVVMEERDYNRRRDVVAWSDAGRAGDYDANATYYYLPLSGYSTVSGVDAKALFNKLRNCGVPGLEQINIYGVRKGDIKTIETQSNWIELEGYLKTKLNALTNDDLSGLAFADIDLGNVFMYNEKIVKAVSNKNSPYVVQAKMFMNVAKSSRSVHWMNRLLQQYAPDVNLSKHCDDIKAKVQVVRERYPLLSNVSYNFDEAAVAEYINLIDAKKGI